MEILVARAGMSIPFRRFLLVSFSLFLSATHAHSNAAIALVSIEEAVLLKYYWSDESMSVYRLFNGSERNCRIRVGMCGRLEIQTKPPRRAG